jgi:hypothetical protein
MEHLDTATLEDFKAFNKKFYTKQCSIVSRWFDKVVTKDGFKILWPLVKFEKIKKQIFLKKTITQNFRNAYRDQTFRSLC